MKTLFVSDLDGTLLGKDSKISSLSARLLNEAISKDALFTVATARTPSTVSILLSDIHTSLPFIVMTGAAMWDLKTRRYFNVVNITPLAAQKILDTIRAHHLPAFAYILRDNIIDIYHTGQLSPLEITFMSERDSSPFKRFYVPEDGESQMPSPMTDTVLFYIMQPSSQVEATYHDVRQIAGCNPIFYHDIFGPEIGIMEIFAAGASKANAVRLLKAQTGADRVVAFGDNLNDLPMLRAADVAIAVENAVPEVKETADLIIGSNDSDAVARFILSATDNPSIIPTGHGNR